MTRISNYKIVNEENLFTKEEVLEMKINEAYLERIFDNSKMCLEFLAKCHLIPNERFCKMCPPNRPLSIIKNTRCVDGFIWSCKRPCTYSCSIRTDTVFYDSKLNFKKIISIIYKYVNGDNFLDIAYELDIDRDTASSWGNLVREGILILMNERSTRIGGLNEDGSRKVVEIDESLFSRRKYNRGRVQDQQWYVGGIERNTRNCFIVPVNNRNADTMAQIIFQYVNPGTLVITDEWRAYGAAMRRFEDLAHESVNHSINFVDPYDLTVHTQNIEGLWSRSKYFLKKKQGISREKQSEYLIQFIWEYGVSKRSRFNNVLLMLQWNRE